MYQTKTKPTTASVTAYLGAIEDDVRRKDCKQLLAMMKRITGCPAKMWGPSLVGFDTYHYKYATGQEGDWLVVGFSSRKDALTVYLMSGYDSPEIEALLAKLGKHKLGKSCLYIKRLSDISLPVLEAMVTRSVTETRRRYPKTS